MKVAIINRSFWPVYPVIGEALLQLSENLSAEGHSVSVIMQDHVGINDKLAEADRGLGVRFLPVKAFTTSSSGILHRAFDAVAFMLWVILALIWTRPKKVYVSTDPPVVVPFVVMLYCRAFNAEYIYHLQDIHPEAARVVIPVNKLVYKFLLYLDCVSLRFAHRVVTITDAMACEIKKRSNTTAPVYVLSNPAVSFDGIDVCHPKKSGFSFCGNAGRLQRMPLLLMAIEKYFEAGGRLEFIFAGGGVYQSELRAQAKKNANFKYLGVVSAIEAAQVNASYAWALLPIEDMVTRYAFPSKSSSYVYSGANILAICGADTSVAKWVRVHGLGRVVRPDVDDIVQAFFDIERSAGEADKKCDSRDKLKGELRLDVFVNNLSSVVFS